MTDDSLMPFGKHRGKKLIEVPDSYLFWLSKENRVTGELHDYIEDNLDAIKENIKSREKEEE